jgi:hypothetical protein
LFAVKTGRLQNTREKMWNSDFQQFAQNIKYTKTLGSLSCALLALDKHNVMQDTHDNPVPANLRTTEQQRCLFDAILEVRQKGVNTMMIDDVFDLFAKKLEPLRKRKSTATYIRRMEDFKRKVKLQQRNVTFQNKDHMLAIVAFMQHMVTSDQFAKLVDVGNKIAETYQHYADMYSDMVNRAAGPDPNLTETEDDETEDDEKVTKTLSKCHIEEVI